MSTNHSDNVTSDTVNDTTTTTTTTITSQDIVTSYTPSQDIVTSDTASDTASISIHSLDSFSTRSHEKRYNTFEVNNFIKFDKVEETDIGTSDSFSLRSIESNQSALSGDFIVNSGEEEE